MSLTTCPTCKNSGVTPYHPGGMACGTCGGSGYLDDMVHRPGEVVYIRPKRWNPMTYRGQGRHPAQRPFNWFAFAEGCACGALIVFIAVWCF